MANPEQLEILQQGVEEWNQWREKHREIMPDISGADLKKRKLAGIDFFNTNLSKANLSQADLTRADLWEANLREANLQEAVCELTIFAEATLACANLVSVELLFAVFDLVVLRGVDLTDAMISQTHFMNTDLAYANLTGASLLDTSFIQSDLSQADFREAELSRTVFISTDLSRSANLESCIHKGPSVIDYPTLINSKNLPISFLRGIGLPETLISYLTSFQETTPQYYSCFISYSEKDEGFSKKLYHSLQDAGIRCWRWRDDAKIGHRLLKQVDHNIRQYDKLIVICSKDSLRSQPVIREIERALQKEDQERKNNPDAEILYPIRLDDAIFSWKHHRQPDMVDKVVGDFRDWKTAIKYHDAFQQLVKALKRIR